MAVACIYAFKLMHLSTCPSEFLFNSVVAWLENFVVLTNRRWKIVLNVAPRGYLNFNQPIVGSGVFHALLRLRVRRERAESILTDASPRRCRGGRALRVHWTDFCRTSRLHYPRERGNNVVYAVNVSREHFELFITAGIFPMKYSETRRLTTTTARIFPMKYSTTRRLSTTRLAAWCNILYAIKLNTSSQLEFWWKMERQAAEAWRSAAQYTPGWVLILRIKKSVS